MTGQQRYGSDEACLTTGIHLRVDRDKDAYKYKPLRLDRYDSRNVLMYA
jgi:hypothetical protein